MSDNDNDFSGRMPSLPDLIKHPDFPAGDDLALLMELRDAIAASGKAHGLREIGRGVGVGGADIQFALGLDRDLIVNIEIRERQTGEQT